VPGGRGVFPGAVGLLALPQGNVRAL